MPRGYPSLTSEQKQEVVARVKEKGERVALALLINKKRARRVMKLFNLKPQRKRKIPRKPKDSGQASMAISNLTKAVNTAVRIT